MRFAELMDFYLEACSDRKQVTDHLEDLLSSFPEKSIIDCSVGTGFITLDLISQGYGIVCTDGSAGMLEQFERNAAELGLEANPVLLDWADLSGTFPDMFDLLICRGNSLVYANVWDDNTAAAGASSIMRPSQEHVRSPQAGWIHLRRHPRRAERGAFLRTHLPRSLRDTGQAGDGDRIDRGHS